MCSVNDYDCGIDDKPPIISKPTNSDDSKCKKCEETETDVVLRGKDAYCKNCFLASSTHKFRATLGKSKIIRPNDKILVAHSGRATSSVLLHLIRAGMHESAHKRLVFKSIVLYIDEGILEGETRDQRRATVEKISTQIKNFGFTGFMTTINESLSESEPKILPLDEENAEEQKEENKEGKEEEEEEEIKKTLSALSEQSAKNDLLLKLRHRLLIRAARHLECNKIFTAESATSLSISILSNIAMGRGAHLSLDVGFADTRHSDLMILRPMRAFTNMEIDYYQRFHNLADPPRPGKINTSKSSIQTLIAAFVEEMDAESHATVSTVLRTGEKLCTMISSGKSEEFCVLCKAALDTEINGEICAIQATNYSQLVSTRCIEPNSGKSDETLRKIESNSEKVEANGEKVEINNGDEGNFEKHESNDKNGSNLEKILTSNKIEENSETVDEKCEQDCECKTSCAAKRRDNDVTILKKSLCYGCRLIVSNFRELNDVPSFVMNSARSSVSFQQMHEEIAEFLL